MRISVHRCRRPKPTACRALPPCPENCRLPCDLPAAPMRAPRAGANRYRHLPAPRSAPTCPARPAHHPIAAGQRQAGDARRGSSADARQAGATCRWPVRIGRHRNRAPPTAASVPGYRRRSGRRVAAARAQAQACRRVRPASPRGTMPADCPAARPAPCALRRAYRYSDQDRRASRHIRSAPHDNRHHASAPPRTRAMRRPVRSGCARPRPEETVRTDHAAPVAPREQRPRSHRPHRQHPIAGGRDRPAAVRPWVARRSARPTFALRRHAAPGPLAPARAYAWRAHRRRTPFRHRPARRRDRPEGTAREPVHRGYAPAGRRDRRPASTRPRPPGRRRA